MLHQDTKHFIAVRYFYLLKYKYRNKRQQIKLIRSLYLFTLNNI